MLPKVRELYKFYILSQCLTVLFDGNEQGSKVVSVKRSTFNPTSYCTWHWFFEWAMCKKILSLTKSENIPGVVSDEFVLSKAFPHSMMHVSLFTEIVQESKNKVIHDLWSLGSENPATLKMLNSAFSSLTLFLYDLCSRVASEISRNEISRNVSRNFYFAFCEIF